jgi:hypothetical protein
MMRSNSGNGFPLNQHFARSSGVRDFQKLEVKEKKINKTLFCLALLVLAGVTVAAQTVPGVITINGGREIVALHSTQSAAHVANPEGVQTGKPFLY